MAMRKQGHRVPPTSTKKIRRDAQKVREVLAVVGASAKGPVDIVDILENRMPTFLPNLLLEVMPDHELGADHARTYPDKDLIQVRESTYTGAMKGVGRDIFTLAHELGHLLMHKGVAAFPRTTGRSFKIYEDSEWQADTFAAEFLMPYAEVLEYCNSAQEIQQRFGVSMDAARYRFSTVIQGGSRT